MKRKRRKWLRVLLFVLGGMLAGLAYYQLVGCASGTCSISSNPYTAMGYMGVVGGLLSVVLAKEDAREN